VVVVAAAAAAPLPPLPFLLFSFLETDTELFSVLLVMASLVLSFCLFPSFSTVEPVLSFLFSLFFMLFFFCLPSRL